MHRVKCHVNLGIPIVTGSDDAKFTEASTDDESVAYGWWVAFS